jgi:hypothetical protein
VSGTKKAGSFTLPGIGKLVISKRKARMGRNPATGEPRKIPAKTVVKMKVAKRLRKQLFQRRNREEVLLFLFAGVGQSSSRPDLQLT